MKNKKRVLTILLVLICLLLAILVIVTAIGGYQNQKYEKYKDTLNEAACDYAKEENYIEELCEAYASLCKVSFNKLIDKKKIDENLMNPLTKKKVSEDTSSYVEITWKNSQMICTLKEG